MFELFAQATQVCEFTQRTGLTIGQAGAGVLAFICIVMAGVGCIREKEGWGWFLFVAFCFGMIAGTGKLP